MCVNVARRTEEEEEEKERDKDVHEREPRDAANPRCSPWPLRTPISGSRKDQRAAKPTVC
jgi:hypothetical protein